MEDVQHMIKHAHEQSFLFIIDSSIRNTNAYPSPSQYYIPFPQPFKNVFAVDVVDATIPRTEFSVDIYNNTLVYAPGTYTTYTDAMERMATVNVSIPPGDYNTATLIQAVNSRLKVAGLERGHTPLRAIPMSNPVDVTNSVSLVRSEPFTLFMNESSMRHVLGFGAPASLPGNNVNWDGTLRYTTNTNVSNDAFLSVTSIIETSDAFIGPMPIELVEFSIPLETSVRQVFVSRGSGVLSSLTIRGRASQLSTLTGRIEDISFDPPALVQEFTAIADPPTSAWDVFIQPVRRTIDIQSIRYDDRGYVIMITTEPHPLGPRELITISGAQTLALNGRWGLIDPSTVDPELDPGTVLIIQAQIERPVLATGIVYASKEILEGREYALVFDANDHVALYKALAFSDQAVRIDLFQSGAWDVYSTQDSMCLDMKVTSIGDRVDAPGQCNLTGERYICIRSPNIEQHMHRDLAVAFDGMTPGLGMVRMGGNTGGYRQERLNFLPFESRRFHPIGKLHGIDIRLEAPSGRLYNSQGIDHTILVCIKMYGPGTHTVIPKTLYPGYEADERAMLVKYLERQRQSECLP